MEQHLTDESLYPPALYDSDGHICQLCTTCFFPCCVFTSIHHKADLITKNRSLKSRSSDWCRFTKCCLSVILPIPLLTCCYYGTKRNNLMKRFGYKNYNLPFNDNKIGTYLLTLFGCYSCMLIQEKKIIDDLYNQENPYTNISNNDKQNCVDDDSDFWFWMWFYSSSSSSSSSSSDSSNGSCCGDCSDCDDCDCSD